ncbi:MAG: hypothetical protein HOW73_17435 [Polyangiaceae bacterium]|nr:hypothetical protein [Polyangiaceae bacterium]
MSRALRIFLSALVALVFAASWLSPLVAFAHMGEEKPKIEGRKRPERPREGPRGRAEVTLEGAPGSVLRLAPGEREMSGSFVLKNVGEGPLEVYRVGFEQEEGPSRTPAGIGISSASRETMPLKPGETRSYTIRFRWEETRAQQIFGNLVVETDGAAPGADKYDPPARLSVVADRRPAPLRHILTIVALLPLAVSLFAAIARKHLHERRLAQAGSALAIASALGACIVLSRFSRLLTRADGNWGLQHIERFVMFGDVEYYVGLDGLNAPLLPLAGIVLFAAALAARPGRATVAAVLGWGGVMASAATFFCISQSLALSAASLVVVAICASMLAWQSFDRTEAAARSAALKTALAFAISAVSFAVFAYLVSKNAFPSRLVDGTAVTRTFALPEIAREAAHGHAAVEGAGKLFGMRFDRGAMVLVVAAFLPLAMCVPLHGWAADFAAKAEGSVGALVLSFASLVSGIGLARFTAPLYPDAGVSVAGFFFAVGIVTVVAAGLRGLFDDDVKSLVGRLGVASGGLTLLALGTATPEGLQGHLAFVVARTLALPLCFLVADAVVARTGDASMSKLGGLASASPRLAVAWLVGLLAACALPGSGSFWALFLGIVASIGRAPWVAVALVLGLVLCALAASRGLGSLAGAVPTSWRTSPELEPYGGTLPDLRRDELPWAVVLTLLLVALAVAPSLWLGLSDSSVLDAIRAIEPPGPTQVF